MVLLVGKHGREKIPNGKLWPQNFLETQARIRTLGSGLESKKRAYKVNGNAGVRTVVYCVLEQGKGKGHTIQSRTLEQEEEAKWNGLWVCMAISA